MKKYNIYIVADRSNISRKQFAENIWEDKLYEKLVICMRQINHLFKAIEVEVWSESDNKYKKDLTIRNNK